MAGRQRAPAWTLRRVWRLCCVILTTVTLAILVSAPACSRAAEEASEYANSARAGRAAGHATGHGTGDPIEDFFNYLRGYKYVEYGTRILVGGYVTTCWRPAGCWVPPNTVLP